MLHSRGSDDLDEIQAKMHKMIPTHTQDLIATGIFLVIMPIGFIFQIFWVLNSWYPAFGEAWTIRVILFLILASNTYINWYKMWTTHPNGRTLLPDSVKPGFRYCHACHMNAPPRAYHCPVCDVCIFRRDHHCSFGGVCVGHFNQRYFCAAIANLWVLLVVLLSYDFEFVWKHIPEGFSIGRIWLLCLPHVAFVLRFISFYQFAVVVFFSCTCTATLFVTYLVGAQIFCFLKGQTRVEYLMDVHAYQIGILGNLRQSLGNRWPLIFLSPFFSSPLPSDGTNFMTREIARINTKNM